MALNELYYNVSVFVYPVAPEDGTGGDFVAELLPKIEHKESRISERKPAT